MVPSAGVDQRGSCWRRSEVQAPRHDDLSVLNPKDSEAAEKIEKKYSREIERYQDEQKDIESEAQQLEKEVATQQHKD